jgi:hypothetical protein
MAAENEVINTVEMEEVRERSKLRKEKIENMIGKDIVSSVKKINRKVLNARKRKLIRFENAVSNGIKKQFNEKLT